MLLIANYQERQACPSSGRGSAPSQNRLFGPTSSQVRSPILVVGAIHGEELGNPPKADVVASLASRWKAVPAESIPSFVW